MEKKYRLLIIEDESRPYKKLIDKASATKYLERLEIIDIHIDPEQTFFTDYIEKISTKENHADIYIVDWELEFINGTYTIQSVFEALQKTSFKFFDKFWIFYSGKRTEITDFMNEFFPNSDFFISPGKNNLIDEIPKSGRDYFEEAIKEAESFFENIQPQWVKDLVGNEPPVIIEGFGGTFIDTNRNFRPNPKDKRRKLSFYDNYFIAMAIDDKQTLYIVIDKDTKQLKIYFFYFGTGTVFPVRDFLRKKGMIDGKGIIYNQFYFDGNILKEKYQKYIHSKTQTLKPSYKYGAEDVTRDVSALLSILKKHGLML